MSGFPMILTGYNENKPELNTFYFNNTERLQEAVEYYKLHKDEILGSVETLLKNKLNISRKTIPIIRCLSRISVQVIS